jgi:hypothetical protein
MHNSLEIESNVTIEREVHPKKDSSPRCSIVEGMQNDESAEQPLNAPQSIVEIFDPDSKMTLERLSHKEKQPISNVSTLFGIMTSETFPKKSLIERRSKSRRKSSDSARCEFPSPIIIVETPVATSAPGPNSRSPEGRVMDEIGQPQKAERPIHLSLESDSNVTVERDEQPKKQYS